MNLKEVFEATEECIFHKYADFDTRTSRQEFQSFFIAAALFSLAIVALYGVADYILAGNKLLVAKLIFIVTIFSVSIPFVAAAVRRFHDSGRSGWEVALYYLLIQLTALAMSETDIPMDLILLVIMVIRLTYVLLAKGETHKNKYGKPVE